MTKERIILALVAVLSGLIIVSSIMYFYQNKNKGGQPVGPRISPVGLHTNGNGKILLEIESPENELVTDKNSIEVKGKTKGFALLVLTSSSEDFVFTANEDGSFSKKVSLLEGENVLTLTAYPENDTSTSYDLVITYTTEEF